VRIDTDSEWPSSYFLTALPRHRPPSIPPPGVAAPGRLWL